MARAMANADGLINMISAELLNVHNKCSAFINQQKNILTKIKCKELIFQTSMYILLPAFLSMWRICFTRLISILHSLNSGEIVIRRRGWKGGGRKQWEIVNHICCMSDDGTRCISVINASAIHRTIELIRKYFVPSDLYGYQLSRDKIKLQ